MKGKIWKVFILFLAAAVLCMSGTAMAQEEEGIFEGSELYNDNDFGNDWFYDTYDYGAVDSDFGDMGWGDSFYEGYYDDNWSDNDWYFDSYDDPGDAGFWDI